MHKPCGHVQDAQGIKSRKGEGDEDRAQLCLAKLTESVSVVESTYYFLINGPSLCLLVIYCNEIEDQGFDFAPCQNDHFLENKG